MSNSCELVVLNEQKLVATLRWQIWHTLKLDAENVVPRPENL